MEPLVQRSHRPRVAIQFGPLLGSILLGKRFLSAMHQEAVDRIIPGYMDKALKEEARRFLEETDPIKYRGLEPRTEETEVWRGRLVSYMEHAAETEDVREAA